MGLNIEEMLKFMRVNFCGLFIGGKWFIVLFYLFVEDVNLRIIGIYVIYECWVMINFNDFIIYVVLIGNSLKSINIVFVNLMGIIN